MGTSTEKLREVLSPLVSEKETRIESFLAEDLEWYIAAVRAFHIEDNVIEYSACEELIYQGHTTSLTITPSLWIRKTHAVGLKRRRRKCLPGNCGRFPVVARSEGAVGNFKINKKYKYCLTVILCQKALRCKAFCFSGQCHRKSVNQIKLRQKRTNGEI